jgi:uncharacterized DUF497 family protein
MFEFEWDEKKNKINIEKHGLPFDFAKYVFDDSEFVRFVDNKKNYNEDRYIGFGVVEDVLFSVSYTIRNNAIRLISFRRARQKELNKMLEIGGQNE